MLTQKIAEITDDFSFAYIQEAFVASLLTIARDSKEKEEIMARSGIEDNWERLTLEDSDGSDDGGGDGDDEDLDRYVLWVEVKKQVAILREGIEHED